MTSRVYSTLDPKSVGPGLLLDSGLAIVTTSQAGLSNSRKILGTVPKAAGDGSFEVYFYSDLQAALGSRVSVGVALAGSPLDKATGEDNLSYGYFPGTGALMWNNLGLVAVPMAVERLCISVYCSATNGRVEWYVSGNYIGGLNPPAGSFFVPSITISGGEAGDIKAFIRCAPPLDFPKIIAG